MEEFSKKKFREICRMSIRFSFCYCYLCGKPIEQGQDWNLDHVHPRALGGKTTAYNLRPVHTQCNTAKGCMTLKQWRALKEQEKER